MFNIGRASQSFRVASFCETHEDKVIFDHMLNSD